MASSSRKSKLAQAILALVSLIALTGFGCRRPANTTDTLDQPLVVWGLWQDSSQMQPIVDAFEDQAGVKVEYKKIASVATYEQDLLAALAEGRGPDVFVIHHTWIEEKRGLMSPAPPEVIDERAVQDEFVGVVAKDVVRDGFVYALPTSVDTLALYVNNDILSGSGVAQIPRTWTEFQNAVQKITRVSRTGQLQQSAAALGTAANVNRAGDIFQMLMLQGGMTIVNADRSVDLVGQPVGDLAQGENYLTFYTDFSNKSKKVFTWDLSQDFSIDAFSTGKTAMMINYSYHIPTIRAKNPRLNFSIAPVPQYPDTPVQNFRTFASYWPFAVSNSSRSPVTAWKFLRFLTSATSADSLTRATGNPPGRKDSAATFSRDPNLGVFADQALTATSWPRVDIVASDGIFNRMIDDVVTGAVAPKDALSRAQDQLKQLIETHANK